jgi:hypothetical protein
MTTVPEDDDKRDWAPDCDGEGRERAVRDGGDSRVVMMAVVGGPAHLFPPFIYFFGGKHFPLLDGLTASHLTKNWTGEQQTASNFSTPWKLSQNSVVFPAALVE